MVQFVQKLNGTLPAVPLNCGRALRYSWGLFSGSCWRFLGSIPSKIWAVFVRPYTGERLLDRSFTRLHCGPSVWANSIYSMDGFLVTPYNGGDVFKRIPPQKKYIYIYISVFRFRDSMKICPDRGEKEEEVKQKTQMWDLLSDCSVFYFSAIFYIQETSRHNLLGGGWNLHTYLLFLPTIGIQRWNCAWMIGQHHDQMYKILFDFGGSFAESSPPMFDEQKGVLCQVQHYVWQAWVPYISMSRMDHVLP